MREVLKKFGRYFLLDLLAQGGMAEIYRARDASGDGPARLLAIKRIHSGHGNDSDYVQMFRSEIKVTMGFSHPNLVQVFDFGEQQGSPFIAMEYVDGKSIRHLISRTVETKRPMPPEVAAYITEQAACGLHYAHSFKDKITGDPLNIVHRDISPQNVLVSYDGGVKIIDFGIAKAATNTEATRAGMIKGKPSYLSPEQISGEKVDARCDVFALGIVLWEMLVGRKLFAGDNDLATLKLIESVNTFLKPPSMFNPSVPKELDEIVFKALTKQRERRFQSAEEFQRAIRRFLGSFAPDFGSADLSYFLKDLFKNDIVEDRKHIQKLNEQAEQLLVVTEIARDVISEVYPTGKPSEGNTTMVGRPRPVPPLPPQQKIQSVEVEKSGSIASRTSTGSSSPRPVGSTRSRFMVPSASKAPGEASSSKRTWFYAAAAIAGIVLFGSELGIDKYLARVPGLSSLYSTRTALVLRGNQKGVTIFINGQTVGESLPLTLNDLPHNTPFHVTVTGASGTFEQDLILMKGEARDLDVRLEAAQVKSSDTSRASVQLKLNIHPGGGPAHIAVNGKTLDTNNPVIQVPMGESLDLVVEKDGFKRFQSQFAVDPAQVATRADGKSEWVMDVPLEPVRFGFVTIHSTPSANVLVSQDGRVVNLGNGRSPAEAVRTPVDNMKLPVGVYNIKLTNEVLGMEKIVTISVEDGKARVVDERLEVKN